jgi:hypothetical protein
VTSVLKYLKNQMLWIGVAATNIGYLIDNFIKGDVTLGFTTVIGIINIIIIMICVINLKNE